MVSRHYGTSPASAFPTWHRHLGVSKHVAVSPAPLRGESKFVFFDGRVDAGKAVNSAAKASEEEQEDALDERSESVEVEAPPMRRSTNRSFKRSPTEQSVRHSTASSVLPSFSSVHQDDAGTDTEDESDDFVVAKMPASWPLKHNHPLISSPTSRRAASSHRYSQLPPALTSHSPCKVSGTWRLESVGTNDASDSDDELDASLDGEQLEALFQRNVRRHEILLGFQSKVQAQAQSQDSNQQDVDGLPHAKMAWSELHQQLESNRRTSIRRKLSATSTCSNDSNPDADDEAALVASSRWLPSSLFTQTEHK